MEYFVKKGTLVVIAQVRSVGEVLGVFRIYPHGTTFIS